MSSIMYASGILTTDPFLLSSSPPLSIVAPVLQDASHAGIAISAF
jgi:hypothetical protein